MKQFLDIEQVQKLMNFGFNVQKHSSFSFIKEHLSLERFSIIDNETIKIKQGLRVSPLYVVPTLTIGDIINILPQYIVFEGKHFKLSYRNANPDPEVGISGDYKVVYFSDKTIIYYCTKNELIDALFDCLFWCIASNYIEHTEKPMLYANYFFDEETQKKLDKIFVEMKTLENKYKPLFKDCKEEEKAQLRKDYLDETSILAKQHSDIMLNTMPIGVCINDKYYNYKQDLI